jgi:NAD(P)-dependent dehydrogenase (short-subunit alcohol dehydrogenase family)
MMSSPESYAWASEWFSGKTVLVTGGSSGIGAGVARAFLAAGANVIATGVSYPEITAAKEGGDLNGADLRVLDVRDATAITALFDGLDTLDCLVNCAGIIRRGEELEPAAFEQVVDINLNGTMRACAAARPLLGRSGGGVIVNLASMLSFFGGGLVPGYSASKGGISQLTKSLAIAYASDQIRVNAVAPGWIETPLTKALRDDPDRSSAILARTPLQRWGKPADVAGAVIYLSSPVASFITGTILIVDGGYSIT